MKLENVGQQYEKILTLKKKLLQQKITKSMLLKKILNKKKSWMQQQKSETASLSRNAKEA